VTKTQVILFIPCGYPRSRHFSIAAGTKITLDASFYHISLYGLKATSGETCDQYAMIAAYAEKAGRKRSRSTTSRT
jgi:hypothetical protein